MARAASSAWPAFPASVVPAGSPPVRARRRGAAGAPFPFFPPGAKSSPWVAHARGAIYEIESSPPAAAAQAAASAFTAVGLTGSFGCADLLQTADGRWLVLEVGSDGLFNHVDRDLGSADFLSDLHRQIAIAFRAYVAA